MEKDDVACSFKFQKYFSMEKYDKAWNDVSYLHVQKIEINDLVFLKLFFQWRNVTWDEVIFVNF